MALYNRGIFLYNYKILWLIVSDLEKQKEAINNYSKVIEIIPKSAFAYFNGGLYY